MAVKGREKEPHWRWRMVQSSGGGSRGQQKKQSGLVPAQPHLSGKQEDGVSGAMHTEECSASAPSPARMGSLPVFLLRSKKT